MRLPEESLQSTWPSLFHLLFLKWHVHTAWCPQMSGIFLRRLRAVQEPSQDQDVLHHPPAALRPAGHHHPAQHRGVRACTKQPTLFEVQYQCMAAPKLQWRAGGASALAAQCLHFNLWHLQWHLLCRLLALPALASLASRLPFPSSQRVSGGFCLFSTHSPAGSAFHRMPAAASARGTGVPDTKRYGPSFCSVAGPGCWRKVIAPTRSGSLRIHGTTHVRACILQVPN